MILTDDEALAKKFNSAMFPGIQGGPLMHVIAAKAVAFGEALRPDFKEYIQQVIKNAQALADQLMKGGLDIVTGGTDTHVMLVDLRPKKVTGNIADAALGRAHITCNKNGVPFDPEKPTVTSGLRLGSPAGTTRGFKEAEFRQIARLDRRSGRRAGRQWRRGQRGRSRRRSAAKWQRCATASRFTRTSDRLENMTSSGAARILARAQYFACSDQPAPAQEGDHQRAPRHHQVAHRAAGKAQQPDPCAARRRSTGRDGRDSRASAASICACGRSAGAAGDAPSSPATATSRASASRACFGRRARRVRRLRASVFATRRPDARAAFRAAASMSLLECRRIDHLAPLALASRPILQPARPQAQWGWNGRRGRVMQRGHVEHDRTCGTARMPRPC